MLTGQKLRRRLTSPDLVRKTDQLAGRPDRSRAGQMQGGRERAELARTWSNHPMTREELEEGESCKKFSCHPDRSNPSS